MRVLLTGTARCGSTWAANVLGRVDGGQTVFEPDGPASDVLGAMVAARLGSHPALLPDQRSFWYRQLWDLAFVGGWPMARAEGVRAAGRRVSRMPRTLRDGLVATLAMGTSRVRKRPRNVIVKSVNSTFSLDWIERRYAPTMVIMRRNPLNIVSSCTVLGLYTTRNIGDLPAVHSSMVAELGMTTPAEDASAITRAAWNVGLLTTALKQAADRHPDWVIASHDDLCLDPLPKFEALVRRLGLRWTSAMEEYVMQSDDPNFTVFGGSQRVHPNAATSTTGSSRRSESTTQFARRLTPAQVAEARAVLAEFPLGDWGPDSY
ncbi:MAG TPA: hypothetical protein VI434_07425 [Candidatus Dormibacteraeota bacterium]